MRSLAEAGAGFWNDSECNKAVAGTQNTFEFPILSVVQSPDVGRNVDVVYRQGFHPTNDRVCGSFQGNTITLFEKVRHEGVPRLCTEGQVLLDTMTHEFGHLLGLIDQNTSACSSHIMGQAGFTPSGSYVDRSLKPDECQKVAETNLTPAESLAIECEADPSICGPDNQCGYIPEYNWCSPIVLDLAKNGFNFSGPTQPVFFDIDADTVREKICWTGTRTEDAFLALDRNENGTIDDGGELFGDSTRFLNGERAQNGYQVLFELDLVRGNQNGYLDRGDKDFERMLLWRDANHDGVSQASELVLLKDTDVYAISAEYNVSIDVDQHGNRLRFRSVAYRSGNGIVPPGVVPTVDVFFAPAH